MRFAAPTLVVVKVGSSSLRGDDGRLDRERVASLAEQVAVLQQAGTQMVLVSSGAVSAGMGLLGLDKRPTDLPTLQACAAVGQSELVQAYQQTFAQHGLAAGQILLTQDDFVRRSRYLNGRQTLQRLLAVGVVPVINENDAIATEELAYGDNDHLAALVASMLGADLLVLLSDVPGLLDRPPTEADARLIERVDDIAELVDLDIGGTGSFVGSGGMRTKVEAAHVATAGGANTVIGDARAAGVIGAAVRGEPVGTWFVAGERRPDARRLWIGYALSPHGTIRIDQGAVRALVKDGRSLLGVGITEVVGDFPAGSAVSVEGPGGTLVARGLVAFDADQLRKMAGRSTTDAAAELGPRYAREAIHRDDLVLRT